MDHLKELKMDIFLQIVQKIFKLQDFMKGKILA